MLWHHAMWTVSLWAGPMKTELIADRQIQADAGGARTHEQPLPPEAAA